MLLLHGHQWSPVAGGRAAGRKDWSSHPGDCGMGWVEEGAAARAVTVQAGAIGFMKLDR